MGNIIVRKIDMPVTVRGLTVLDGNGDYNVYINSRLCKHQQDLAYEHELIHIENGDFYTEESVADKERRIPF